MKIAALRPEQKSPPGIDHRISIFEGDVGALSKTSGLSVAAGLLSRLGSVALGLFCLATAFLFHTNFASQNELLHFEKDLAIAGGMFVLAVRGAGSISIDNLVKRQVKEVHPWLKAVL